jgi:hypothetical protein
MVRQGQELKLCNAVKEGASVLELKRLLLKGYSWNSIENGVEDTYYDHLMITPASVVCRSDGMPLLHLATLLSHTHIMRWLVEQGCALDGKDGEGRTAEDIAKAMQIAPAVQELQELQDLQHIAGAPSI